MKMSILELEYKNIRKISSLQIEELGKLQEQKTRLNARFADVEDKLIKAGGPQVEQLQSEIEVLIGQISSAQTQLKIIESKDEEDERISI